LRELRERGYEGGYTAVTDVLREIRPAPLPAFEIRFKTPPGDQAQAEDWLGHWPWNLMLITVSTRRLRRGCPIS
jgi:hypothetical protein